MKTRLQILIRVLKSPIFWQFPGPILLIGRLLFSSQALYWGTVYLQFTPWRLAAWRMISQGILPLWNDANGLGAPLLANYQTAFFYPPNWLIIIGTWFGGAAGIAWIQTLLVVMHLIASGVGFVYLLRALGMKPLTQTIGGLAYSLCGYQVARASFLSINSALVWLPLLLWVTREWIRCWKEGDFKRVRTFVALHTLFSGMQLLAGHAQVTWYTQMIVLAWSLLWIGYYSPAREWIKQVSIYGGASVFAGALALVQLLPTAEYLLQSQRASAVDYDYALNYSFWPWRAVTLLAPNLFGNPGNGGYVMQVDNYWEDAIYIGLIPIIFAILTLFYLVVRGKKLTNRDKLVGWYAVGITVLGFMFALGWRTPVFPFLYRNIPTFDIFQGPTRFSLWCEVGLILLACIGLDRWHKPSGKQLYWSRLGMMGAVTALLTAIAAHRVFTGKVSQSFLNASLETAIIFCMVALLNLIQPGHGKWRTVWKIAMTTVICGDLVYAGCYLNPGMPLSDYHKVSESSGRSKLIYISQPDEEALKFNRFFIFNDFEQNQDWNALTNFMIPDSNLYRGDRSVSNFDPFVPAAYPDWMELIGKQSDNHRNAFLAWLGVDEIHTFSSLDQSSPDVIELSAEMPFHYFSKYQVIQAEDDIFTILDGFVQSGDYRKVLIVNGLAQPPDGIEDGTPKADISVMDARPDRVQIQFDAPKDGWIIQAATYYPGWIAEVDGKEAEIYQADGYLRAIPIPAGEHELEIRYQPASFWIGLSVSCLSWIFLVLVTIGTKRRMPHGR